MNQMVPRPQQNNQWGAEREAITPAQQQEPPTTWSDDINELVAKAQVAKREAQSKKKQRVLQNIGIRSSGKAIQIYYG